MKKSNIQVLKDRASKLLKFFNGKASEKFEAVQIVDSEQSLEYGELATGAVVSISSSEGSKPAADGDYKLSNGAEITVRDGVIEAITKEADEAKEEVVEVAEEMAAEEAPVVPVVDHTEITALNEKVAGLEEILNKVLSIIEEVPTKEDVEQFNSKVKALAKLPTQVSSDNRVEIKDSVMEKYNHIAGMYSNK